MKTPLTEKILYLYAIPAFDRFETTLFQGFAPGLVPLIGLISLPLHLAGDIVELTMAPSDRLLRRRTGFGGWIWSPVSVDALLRGGGPSSEQPFSVIFTADTDVAARVQAWSEKLLIKPLHVSEISEHRGLAPEDLNMTTLQSHCLKAIDQAGKLDSSLDTATMTESIKSWGAIVERSSSLRLHSHNVTLPNEMVLVSTGEAIPVGTGGVLKVSPHQDYVDAISESAMAVLTVQNQVAEEPVLLIHPPFPDIILFAPGTFHGIIDFLRKQKLPRPQMQLLKALDRQEGYIFPLELDSPHEELSELMPLLWQRTAELKLQAFTIGMRAASTLAATIRLPGAINRTANVVAQLSRHLRYYDDVPPDKKTARVFKTVQDALVKAIAPEHLEVLSETRTCVKVISDAPLEWLPINGLPLGIRSDVSRINATPGNVLIDQLRVVPPLQIPSVHFRDFLVVSMFDEDDPRALHVPAALQVLSDEPELQIKGTRVTPTSEEQFVEAVNAYRGPMLIVDSHGDHPKDTNIGGLIIGGKSVDVWGLRGRIRVPPIVILSACDTHPFDRSHASVANGFLTCGAITVLATVLPIRSKDAAMFLAKLIRRAIMFGDAMNHNGLAVPWTKVIGGLLRMQLAVDVLYGLVRRKMLQEELVSTLHFQANCDINLPRPDWFERLGENCRQAGQFDEAAWQVAFDDILAGSDVIRYVNLGNPEAIIISDDRVSFGTLAQRLDARRD